MTSPVVSECCHARTGASIELGAPPVAPLLCCALRWPHLCLGTSVILVGMAKDGMKRLAATARGGRSPTVVHAVVCRKRWRPAMEHLGIDVHKVESQICILTESGKVVERRIRTQRERFAAVLGERPRARVLIEASTESEWVARCLEELGHEVVVADPNFAAMYATRSRKVKTDLRDARTLAEACKLGAYRAAHRTSDRQRHVRTQLSDAGGAGADESALHLADQCPAAARGPARRERECGEFCQARCKARAALAIEVGDRAAAGGVCVGRSATRLDRHPPRASRADRRDEIGRASCR